MVLLTNANFNTFLCDRNLIAYKVHNAIAGLPSLKLPRAGEISPQRSA